MQAVWALQMPLFSWPNLINHNQHNQFCLKVSFGGRGRREKEAEEDNFFFSFKAREGKKPKHMGRAFVLAPAVPLSFFFC